ncbi:MAG TPA: CRISPR-associated protein Cas4 [Candidatus Caldiarchaeum subterraneum]|uniref:CRISPR-associated exonuclease Cas4 n=1 Tax=Caldiarchaeum subterraneum TaxID=311458 RepID=A0A833ECW4_CALS0|nr:CRISPR-associated protein Cas4 [Candidatus Caldarchaeum subterraneum]
MSGVEEGYLTVVDVKRYAYCPRIVFITHILHLEEVTSEAMQMGIVEHDERVVTPLISRLKVVRVLRNVALASERLRIVGKLDFLLLTRFGEYVPVEVKWAETAGGRVKWDHKMQLASYALLVEERFKTTVKRGYAYYLREHKLTEVPLHEGIKRLATEMIEEIHEMLERERDPGIRVSISKCLSCGYRAFCRPIL